MSASSLRPWPCVLVGRRAWPLALLLIAGCAATASPPRPELEGPGAASPAEAQALVAQGDQLWRLRDDPAPLAAALSCYEQALAAAPDRSELLVRLAEGEFLAGHAAAGEPDKLEHWRRGHAWGEALLRTDPTYAAALDEQGREATEALTLLGAEAVPALYWTALNLTAWSTRSGLLAAATNMGRFRALMQRVEQLDPHFDDGGVDRFFAVDLASAPALAGGDRDAADERFVAALELAPGRFVNRTLYVEHLLLPDGRLSEARAHLRRVLDADAEAEPLLAPEQRAAQAHARALWEQLVAEGG